jgi:hypothetical protein
MMRINFEIRHWRTVAFNVDFNRSDFSLCVNQLFLNI